jgi:hypothetical protein
VSGPNRVIVGTSGSPGSLCALRYAGYLARVHDATVTPVLTWIPPGGELASRRSPSFYLYHVWDEDAWQRLREALVRLLAYGCAIPSSTRNSSAYRACSPKTEGCKRCCSCCHLSVGRVGEVPLLRNCRPCGPGRS